MWAMKGNRSWPGEEECVHLAGSFLCIHLGSSRSPSCSDQAFIRLQAAQTQLAQCIRESRFPSPADISKNEWKHFPSSAMPEDRPGKKWFSTPQTPYCTQLWTVPSYPALGKQTYTSTQGSPSPAQAARQVSDQPRGESILQPSCMPLTEQRPHPWPNQPRACNTGLGMTWRRAILYCTLKLASEVSSREGTIVTLVPLSHRLKLPETDSPMSASQIRPIFSMVFTAPTQKQQQETPSATF